MFRFTRDNRLPLADAKTISRWYAGMPKADLFGRQGAVLGALADLAERRLEVGPDVAHALLTLDDLTLPLRRALMAQYVELSSRPGQVERRVWKSAFELTQAFLAAYQLVADAADSGPARRWKSLEPALLLHRVIHLGLDSRYRLFRFEKWIPGKWQQLHRLYSRARELGVERSALPVAAASDTTVEREYLRTVLLQLMDSGNLPPVEVATVADRLGEWAGWVSILPPGTGQPTFTIDLSTASGARAVKPDKPAEGDALLLLDTRALQAHIAKAEAAVRRKLAIDPLSERVPARNAQLALLLKLGRELDPASSPLTRRFPRTPASGGAVALVGFARICTTLRDEDVRAASGVHQMLEAAHEPHADQLPDAWTGARYETTRKAAYGAGAAVCELRDTSAGGMRLSMPVTESTAFGIGTLIAVIVDGQDEWSLGVIRRVRRTTADRADVALQLLAHALVGVELEASHGTDTGYTVDGESVALATTRYRAIFLARPAGAAGRSLIVPRNIHDTRTIFRVTTARARYDIRLGTIVEQQPDWIWCNVDVLTPGPAGITLPSDPV